VSSVAAPTRRRDASVPGQSRAAVLTAPGEPLVLRELPIPEVEPGALLVKIEVATLCGSDAHIARGRLAIESVAFPVVPGHEFVGKIVEIGAGAEFDSMGEELKLGDRVVWEHEPCGKCVECTLNRQPQLCRNKNTYGLLSAEQFPYLTGGCSEYAYVFPRSGRLRVPDGVDSEWASASSCAARTVMAGYERLGRIAPWQSVVVQGAGPLGLFATAVARRAGAKRVIVVGAPEQRLALARAYGADHTITIEGTTTEQRAAQIRDLTEGEGADIVMEFSGGPGAVPEGIDFVRSAGRIVVVGQVSPGVEEVEPWMITKKNVSILGSFSAGIAHYWQALQLLQVLRDDVDWGAMISSRTDLTGASEALDRMGDHVEIKPAIYPGGVPA
jgi:L-iditol 2-dehydrogenase